MSGLIFVVKQICMSGGSVPSVQCTVYSVPSVQCTVYRVLIRRSPLSPQRGRLDQLERRKRQRAREIYFDIIRPLIVVTYAQCVITWPDWRSLTSKEDHDNGCSLLATDETDRWSDDVRARSGTLYLHTHDHACTRLLLKQTSISIQQLLHTIKMRWQTN